MVDRAIAYMNEWMQPNIFMFKKKQSHYLSYLFLILFGTGMIWILYSVSLARSGGLKELVSVMGVKLHRVATAASEIERKTFHIAALAIPTIYGILLDQGGWTQQECGMLCVQLTAAGWITDLSRLYIPIVRNNFPLARLLRDKEKNRLCGACYLSLGCTLAIYFFPPPIAMASITFLVLGDMSAALIGVSFGGESCTLKLGREGKKSLEGSVAMLVTCFVIGCIVFRAAPLSEYISMVGAVVATIVELYEPFGLNDNLTIPVFTSFALTWAFQRVSHACTHI